jgi:ribosomal-protein-alanine N-acetyltransferase
MLLDDFLDRAREEDINRVHLEVRDGNPAVTMYREAGFSPVGRRRNYYHASDGRRFDAITLAIRLT